MKSIELFILGIILLTIGVILSIVSEFIGIIYFLIICGITIIFIINSIINIIKLRKEIKQILRDFDYE